ncbi:MAG TPA: CHAP domain-containing protein [Ktedonobacterales bacterium]|nr:CHAP domain-containing protein [Ktedonobacterales bacterium]
MLALMLVTLVGLGVQVQRMTAQPTRQVNAASCSQQTSPGANLCFTGNSLISDSLSQSASSSSHASVTVQPGLSISPVTPPAATGQLCHDKTMWVAKLSNWTAPPGCYAKIYQPDQRVYSSPTSFGYCNWWVEALHPKHPDILLNQAKYTIGTKPVPGAAMWFDPGVQGASSAGHWAVVVAVNPDNYWMLITEMNFAWRGGGFGRVDYRYVHVGPDTHYIYTAGED